jgi:protein phosphatase
MSDACTLRYAAVSNRGLVRAINEDSLYAGPRLVVVADGVGGHAAGEVASELVVSALAPLDSNTDASGDPVDALRTAVRAANDRLRTAVEADPALTGMGTTLTALLLSGETLALAHAGDSRAYRLRDGGITQLTRDDTYVQRLIDEGCISAEEADTHPHRSVVTRVLQGSPVEATYESAEAVPGDRYLLCSDGLTAAVPVEVITAVLRDEPDPDRCVACLMDAALAGGAPDNVTVVVADVVTRQESPASPAGVRAALLATMLIAAVAAGLWWLAARVTAGRTPAGRSPG